MWVYRVLCSNTNDIVHLGYVSDPENACYRAIGTGNGWGQLDRFRRSDQGEPKTEDGRSWLCLIVFDLSGCLNQIRMFAMTIEGSWRPCSMTCMPVPLSPSSVDRGSRSTRPRDSLADCVYERDHFLARSHERVTQLIAEAQPRGIVSCHPHAAPCRSPARTTVDRRMARRPIC
jgi:hypothetical protein